MAEVTRAIHAPWTESGDLCLHDEETEAAGRAGQALKAQCRAAEADGIVGAYEAHIHAHHKTKGRR